MAVCLHKQILSIVLRKHVGVSSIADRTNVLAFGFWFLDKTPIAEQLVSSLVFSGRGLILLVNIIPCILDFFDEIGCRPD